MKTIIKQAFAAFIAVALLCAVPYYAYGEPAEGIAEEAVPQVIPPEDLGMPSTDTFGETPIDYFPPDVSSRFPQITCARAAVMDDNGNILMGRAIDERVKIASITKIMTAILACEFDLASPVAITPYAASIPGSSAELIEGDIATLYELVEGLMLPSGNDAAYAIAIHCGREMLVREGSEVAGDDFACIDRFVAQMNTKAQELGMSNTVFSNPCGLDDEGFEGAHCSTARDVAIMTKAAWEIEPLHDIVGKPYEHLSLVRSGVPYEIPLRNTNRLLLMNEHAHGMKTGFTDQAGHCVSCIFEKDGGIYTIVVLGAESGEASFDNGNTMFSWLDTIQEKRDGWQGVAENLTEVSGYYLIGKIPVSSWITKSAAIGVEASPVDYSAYFWEASAQASVTLDDAARSSVKAGDVVGTMTWSSTDGTVIAERNIVALESVEEPNAYEKLCIAVLRLVTSLMGVSSQESILLV